MTPAELKTIRSAMGLTQTQLAQALKVGLRSVQAWESQGRQNRPIPGPAIVALEAMQMQLKRASRSDGT
jgi:DNA-binding transcriptional regulator YiaG